MAKNNKISTAPPQNADGQNDAPDNPWTQNFAQIARYLVRDYRDKVTVMPEFPLFQEPMKIDAVIIIQEDGLVIDNALMRSFKRHNIVEFKSPNDTLNIQAFDKTISYFYAYISNERESGNKPISANNITLSIVSVRKPIKVLGKLKTERGFKIVDTETPGIYYITREGFIPEKIQLVVSSELPADTRDQSLAWLRSLRNNLTPEEAVETVNRIGGVGSGDSMLPVVRFILNVNPNILEKVENMIEDPRVKKFWNNVAIKTGAAQQVTEERLKDVARKMLAKDISIDEVVEFTGLDRADVVMIASSMV